MALHRSASLELGHAWGDPGQPDLLSLDSDDLLYTSVDDDGLLSLDSFEADPFGLQQRGPQGNDRQFVLAAQEAAGLAKGGIRRAAFSTNDLQALSSSFSAPGPSHQSVAQPWYGLEAVDENGPQGEQLGLPPLPDLLLPQQLPGAGPAGPFASLPPTSAAPGQPMSFSHTPPLIPTSEPFGHVGPLPGLGGRGGCGPSLQPTIKEEAHFPGGPSWALPEASSSQGGSVATRASTRLSLMNDRGDSRGSGSAWSSQTGRTKDSEGFIRRSRSAVDLRSTAVRSDATGPTAEDLLRLTNPEGVEYRVGCLTREERAQKILRYREKRHERNFQKRVKYQCRKALADSRPRVRGRFARSDELAPAAPQPATPSDGADATP